MKQLLTLESYKDARKGHSTHSFKSQLPVLLGLGGGVLVLQAVAFGAFKLIPQGPNWLWQVVAVVGFAAAIVIPIILWGIRRPERMAAAKVLLRCPHCDKTPSESTVLTTGRCDECFEVFVRLPELVQDAGLPQQREVADAFRRSVSPAMLFLVLAPLMVGAVVVLIAALLEYQMLAGGAILLMVVLFFFGIFRIERERKKGGLPAKCGDCGKGLEPTAIQRVIATCRCPFCGVQTLNPSNESVPADQKLNRLDVKAGVDRIKKSQVLGWLSVMLLGSVSIFSVKAFGEGTVIGQAVGVGAMLLCVVPVAMFIRTMDRAFATCPACNVKIDKSYLLMITGHCCHCGVEVCE